MEDSSQDADSAIIFVTLLLCAGGFTVAGKLGLGIIWQIVFSLGETFCWDHESVGASLPSTLLLQV